MYRFNYAVIKEMMPVVFFDWVLDWGFKRLDPG
jgi:hypothetical protein